jgi:glycosyltransferase involved in cell wall biosynthesis
MKITIITVVWNNEATIKDAIHSVLNQTYEDIEYIVIDGASTDGTLEVVRSFGDKIAKLISEPDTGLYDAMNKGMSLATGDVIGLLNSDDFYIDNNVISRVMQTFEEKKVESIFADLVYVKPGNLDKIVRYYHSGKFDPSKFAYGLMPAHPTFFAKKEVYSKFGVFRTDLKIAADFDILVRFLYTYSVSYHYMQEVLVKMRVGGVSTSFSSLWTNNIEILRVCHDNDLHTNILKILSRYPNKFFGLFVSQFKIK